MGRLVPPMMAVGVLALAGVTFPSRSEAGPVPGMSECLLRPPAAQSRGGAAAVRVEALMSARGEHMGRRVEVTTARGVPVTLSLARESFVGSPGVGRMVYGQATADGSEVRAIDLQSGCDVRLHASRDVARSALLDEAAEAVYVHSVTATDRSDAGVTRHDLRDGGTRQVLEPFSAGHEFGPVYATTLALADDGAALVVQSCGFDACHTRVVELGSGAVSAYDAEHGSYVGMTGAELLAFEAGHARPAALLAVDRRSGLARIVAEEVHDARLDGGQLSIETVDGWQEVAP